MKPDIPEAAAVGEDQPPPGGCVLKLSNMLANNAIQVQPPPGGCVLKQFFDIGNWSMNDPAAFRRLCVETWHIG